MSMDTRSVAFDQLPALFVAALWGLDNRGSKDAAGHFGVLHLPFVETATEISLLPLVYPFSIRHGSVTPLAGK